MIKLVKNEFFIYCKETRIENNRSFYGSFSLGPFDSGQSITIANALRRTLLSELKGLAITSAEIEGAFHEYSTLPGVRDSILDILLNLKDIVLKTENYGNKKRGTSYATTFKKTQIGYLKTRGPGIITASELKLPPGIQCVDPDQYIATLSEEGILNIKLMINEGKNYVLQNSYSQNQNSNLYYNDKPRTETKEYFLGKKLSGENLAKKVSLKKLEAINKPKNIQPLSITSLVNSGSKNAKGIESISERDFITYINFKRRRLWLHKRNLFKTPSLFLGNKSIPKNLFTNKAVKIFKSTLFGEFKSFLVLPTKDAFLCKQKKLKSGLLLPVLTMVKKIRSIKKTTQSANYLNRQPLLTKKLGTKVPLSFQKKDSLFSFLLIKKGTLRAGVKGFFENRKKYKDNLQSPVQESNYISLNNSKEVREGRAITATKAVSLTIDAVFMPVNKVNYIIETNEQSVMSSEKNFSNRNSIPSFGLGAQKSKSLPIFTPNYAEQTAEKKLALPSYLSFVPKSEPFLAKKLPFIVPSSLNPKGVRADKITEEQPGEISLPVEVLQRKIRFQNRGCYLLKKKNLPLPFPVYKSKELFFPLNNFNKEKSYFPLLRKGKARNVSYFVRVGKRVSSEGTCSGTSSFFVRNNIIIFQKKKNDILSQQLRFLKNYAGLCSFFIFKNKPTPFNKDFGEGFSQELKRARVLPSNKEAKEQRLHQVPYSIKNEQKKKIFLKSAAAQKTKILETQLNNSINTNMADFSLPQSFSQRNRREGVSLQSPYPFGVRKEKIFLRNKMRLSDNQTKTSLKNNIILEIWTNGSIHPRQALYEACKNLLSLFSKLEKATPLAFPQKTPNIS